MSRFTQMVGKHFLKFDAQGQMSWQGRIITEPTKGVYLCQLYEWLTGGASDQVLVKIEDMMHWQFYDSAEDRNDAAQRKMEADRLMVRDESETAPN